MSSEKVVVSIAGQTHETVAGSDGNWRVKLNPLKVEDGPIRIKGFGR